MKLYGKRKNMKNHTSSFILLLPVITALYNGWVSFADENCATNYSPCICEKQANELFIEGLIDHNANRENFALFSDIFKYDAANKLKNDSSITNCSNRKIRTIPKFRTLGYTKQPSIDCLDLSNNRIEIISESVFYGLIFRCIDFSFNRIFKVSRNAFSGLLNSLYILKFNNNELTSASLPAYFISKLTQLQVLFMSNNKIDRINERSFQTVFEPKLKILDLSYNTISCIHDEGFNGLSSLSYLNLCNNQLGSSSLRNSRNCSISNLIKINFLKNLPALENLQLCSNNLDYIYGGVDSFKYTTVLKILNLRQNQIKTLNRMLCPISSENKHSNIYLKNLIVLNLGSNIIFKIEPNDLNCLSYLHELHLDSNKLDFLSTRMFKNLSKLRLLTINNNPGLIILSSHVSMLFYGLQNSLTHLSISFNSKANNQAQSFNVVVETILNQLRQLEYLDMSGSIFDVVNLNLASLLFRRNKLRQVKCINCAVRLVEFDYDLITDRDIKNQIEENNWEDFNENFRQFICAREMARKDQKFIVFDFDNKLSSTESSSENVSKRLTNNCELNPEQPRFPPCSKKLFFISKLARFVHVNNFKCLDQVDKSVAWYSYAVEKLDVMNRHFESSSCLNDPKNMNKIDCFEHWETMKKYDEEEEVSSSNGYEMNVRSSCAANTHMLKIFGLVLISIFLFYKIF